MNVPHLRMFAGPNGSGKSTLKRVLRTEWLGMYLNPDDIELEIRQTGTLDLIARTIETSPDEVRHFFTISTLYNKIPQHSLPRLEKGKFVFEVASSYAAAAAADFLRHRLLTKQISFTFETVMSHPSKLEIFDFAKRQGYRNYLYYIATNDPSINISRVAQRVATKGHSVPQNKIVDRYYRSLELLLPAIQKTDRAYIFDNSKENVDSALIAEITSGHDLIIKKDIPNWFKSAVLDKIQR